MKLTPTMIAAVKYANDNGGKLIRYPGGFWCKDGLQSWTRPWFGTSTVEALVKRKWQQGRHGQFPVEMTVTHLVNGER